MENSKGLRIAATVVRYLIGLIFLVFSLAFFFQFFEMPAPEGAAGAFMGALFGSGYFFQMLKVFELLASIMLLTGLYRALGIAILAPITLNIFMFHAVLAQDGLPMGAFLFLGIIFLAWAHRENFKGIFTK